MSGGAPATDEVSEPGSIAIDVLFLETPHRLRLSCHPGTGTFVSRWVTAPLQDAPLSELRMPTAAR